MSNDQAMPVTRTPRFIQGLTLISLAWVSTIAAVVLGPILPEMRRVFADVPYVDVKISLVATGPSLLVAVMAIPFGIWADRVGRRSLLLISLFLYGLAGTAPLWLEGLDTIVATRIALGLAEAAIMTTGTALISDYFQGQKRERWLAGQAGAAPLTAVFLAVMGGILGGFGWRTPFYVYTYGFVLVPLIWLLIWEPVRDTSSKATAVAQQELANFSWTKPLWIALAIVLSMIMFMVTVIQFGFLVTERGMILPQTIGMWSAVITLANPLGSLLFVFTKGGTSAKLTIAYVLFAIGFITMASIPSVDAAIVGGFIANLGAGFFLPTAITWLLSNMPPAVVGRGSGLWSSAVFAGQFLGPLAVLGLIGLTGTLSNAILSCGVICAIAGAAALTTLLKQRASNPA